MKKPQGDECKNCGLMRVTILATEVRCLKGKEHDFGDHGISFPQHNESWAERFDKKFVYKNWADEDCLVRVFVTSYSKEEQILGRPEPAIRELRCFIATEIERARQEGYSQGREDEGVRAWEIEKKVKEEVVMDTLKIVNDYNTWCFSEKNLNLNQERTMLAYDFDSRYLASKQIIEKIKSYAKSKGIEL